MINAFVFINTTRPSQIVALGTAIAGIEGVYECYSVTGEFDLIAVLRVGTHEEIATVVTERIAALEGIRSTTTTIAFRAYSRADLAEI
ncbi:MAG: Lrp/AsnC family transcriptional regulator [Acidimicrobiales bacterium]